MLREMPNRETNPGNLQNQPDRRKQNRREERQPEGWPSDERRKEQRRENTQMTEDHRTGGIGETKQDRNDMTPDSLPRKDNSPRQTPENWQGENFQSGTSQAQRGEGHKPQQQTVPAERHEQKGSREPKGEHTGEGKAGYSNPPPGKEFGPGGRERSFGREHPQKKQENETGNFGVSYDRGFGQQPGQGAGGETDSSQRDMGQTGQTK